jgi:uroporphyrinogen decarboxylase
MTITSQQRLRKVALGQQPNHFPVLAFAGGYAARIYGLDLHRYYTDMEACYKCQKLSAEMHGYDDGPNYGWADWGGWEFGGEITFPESFRQFAPVVTPVAIRKPSDVEKLAVPEPAVAGANPNLLHFNRICRSDGLPAKIFGGTVTTYVGSIIGKERLLKWLYREPDALRTVYEKATEFILSTTDLMIAEFGASNCVAGFTAPLESNDVISSRHFEKFGLPYLNKVVDGMKKRGIEKFSLHMCGDHTQNLLLWSGIPLPERSTISVGSQMDIAKVADTFGHKHIIAGNISTTTLAVGSFDDVYQASKRCIETYRDLPGGYILMPACELPVLTPPLNVYAMVKAAKDLADSP